MNTFLTILVWMVAVVVIWTGASFYGDVISDHEVITPEDGVRCVVVSRAFNTSVDCWLVVE